MKKYVIPGNISQINYLGTLVLIAAFKADLAGLNLSYPKNLSLKPKKPSWVF